MVNEIVSKLNGGEILGLCGIVVGLLALLGGLGVAVTKVVASYYRRTQLDEMEATLKLEMIQRGMSADDIKQVLEAKMGSSRRAWLQEMWAAAPIARAGGGFCGKARKSEG
jgi:hypothetical protein